MNAQFQQLFDSVRETRSISKIKVDVRRLNDILNSNEPEIEKIDILAIDVEGWELSVLKGISMDVFEPKVVILENLFDNTEYHDYMARHGYSLWAKLEPNEIYISGEINTIGVRCLKLFGDIKKRFGQR